MGAVATRLRVGGVDPQAEVRVADRPGNVHTAEVRAARVGVDRDPLLVEDRGAVERCARDQVDTPAVDDVPRVWGRRAPWPDRDPDSGSWQGRIDAARDKPVLPIWGIREHVRQHDDVEIAPGIKCARRIGVVGPAFVAGNMADLRPGGATVEGLEEAGEMVVALGVHDPLAHADQMPCVGRVDVEVRLGEILRTQRWVGHVLCRVRADVLACGRRAGALGGATVRIPLTGRKTTLVAHLRGITADALCGRADARHATLRVTRRKRRVRLGALRRRCVRDRNAEPPAGRDDRGDASSHGHEHSDAVNTERFVARLASARIGATFNFYRDGEGADERRRRLREYLEERARGTLLLVGEAAGYRGARVSGIPFTSERQLSGTGPAEATATIVQRVLQELELEALCWNVVPSHPGTETSNRAPTKGEVAASRPFLEELAEGRRLIAVGRLAERVTGAPYVRHPAHGGGAEFRAGLLAFA